MALKPFLLYIGVFFTGSAALLAVVKTLVLNFTIKKPMIYGIISSVVTSAVAFGIMYITENPSVIYWILTALFFVFGMIHLWFTHKRYFNPKKSNPKVLTGEFLFSLSVIFFTIVAFSSLLYFFKDKQFMFFPVLMSALIFFVPFLFRNMFIAAYGIPGAQFVTWQYPAQVIDLPDEAEGEKLLVIGFEIAKNNTDAAKTYFRAKAPENMLLGDLYYHFINDYNELQSETPIRYADADKEMTAWWFRLKPKWYQPNRILDPKLTVAANGITENSVIICERLEG
jgi:hypothetical protein